VTNNETFDRVIDSHRLVSVYGHWPSFRGAELISLGLHKVMGTAHGDSQLNAVFIVADPHRPLHTARQNAALTNLQFFEVERLNMSGFAHDAELSELHIDTLSRPIGTCSRLKVTWKGVASGHRVSFDCDRMAVVAVELYAD
jgi:Immunity protein 50